jgi:predicted metal-binding protein
VIYPTTMSHEVIICEGCGGRDLAAALGPLLPTYSVRLVACMSVCSEPVTVAFKANRKATYLFSGVTAADTADAVAFAQLFSAAPNGWITDARPAGRMRFCLKGRIPD